MACAPLDIDFTKIEFYASVLLALIPALVWLIFIFRKTKRLGIQIALFLMGTTTVGFVFLYQYFLCNYPQFDVINFLENKTTSHTMGLIIFFIGVGITEEIVKQAYIRILDKRYLLIQTINDSIQFSLVSALGFSFAENIVYTYRIWTQLGAQQLIIAFAFRSIFTTCAHLIFSGFFGYYYGIAKFSLNIREQSKWIGKKRILTGIIAKVMKMSPSEALKEQMILKGLFIAIILHASFNFIMELNLIIVGVIFVILGYLTLQHLLKSKAGRLIMVTDITEQRSSSMAKTDEEVVIELVGMWFKEKRYVDVLHICGRILERDPDNKIVQLFKAQAIDKMDESNPFSKVLKKLYPSKEQRTLQKLMEEKSKEPSMPTPTSTPAANQPKDEPPEPESSSPTFNLKI